MNQLLICTLLVAVAVAVTTATEEKRLHGYIGMRVHFEMEHQLGDIKPHTEMLKKAIHEHMAMKLRLEKALIKNFKLMPKGSMVIVQFEVYHGGKYDVKGMLLMYKGGLQHHKCGIRYHGHTMHPRFESFKMDEIHKHHEGHPKEHGGWWSKCKGNKMYMYGGGMLIMLIIIIVVAVTVTCVCVRKRRACAARCAAKGSNFKQNLTMDNNPYVVMPEEKKVPLA